jgi:hypothetical protein
MFKTPPLTEAHAQYLIDLMANLGYEPPYMGEDQTTAFAKIIRCIESLAIKAKAHRLPEEDEDETLFLQTTASGD